MFQISKCRGDGDLGLCTTSVLAFGEPMRSGDFQKKRVSKWEKSDFAIAMQFLNASTEDVHRFRSQSTLHFDNGNI
jgi:hypothetical protein